MPNLVYTKVLPFSPTQMFSLVMDIEKYPEFLSWCKKAKIIQCLSPNNLVADLTIKFKLFNPTYRSNVRATNNPTHSLVKIVSDSNFFDYFNSSWDFKGSDKGTEVTFQLNFQFKVKIIAKLSVSVLSNIARQVMLDFEQRAFKIYNPIT